MDDPNRMTAVSLFLLLSSLPAEYKQLLSLMCRGTQFDHRGEV